MPKRSAGLEFLRIPKCWRETDSGCVNALVCFSIFFSLYKIFICVGEGIYIWIIKNVSTAVGLSEFQKTELKG